MKILVVFGFLSLSFPFLGWSQKMKSDRESAGLIGSVHEVREYRTQGLKTSDILKLSEHRPYKTLTYDRSGMLLEEDNLYGLHYVYAHGSDGIRIKTAVGARSPGSGDLLPPHVVERYSDKFETSGRKSETITFLPDGLSPWTRSRYEYDESGRLIKLSNYWRDPALNLTLTHVITYTYVNRDEKEMYWRYVAKGEIDRWSYSNYKHDGKGNWVERTETRYQTYDPYQPKNQQSKVYRFIDYY